MSDWYEDPPKCRTHSVPDAARIIGIGKNSCYEAIRAGTIRAIRIGRCIRVADAEIGRLLGEDYHTPDEA